jgi:hypothetical protein
MLAFCLWPLLYATHAFCIKCHVDILYLWSLKEAVYSKKIVILKVNININFMFDIKVKGDPNSKMFGGGLKPIRPHKKKVEFDVFQFSTNFIVFQCFNVLVVCVTQQCIFSFLHPLS